jgi:hypothetical protein
MTVIAEGRTTLSFENRFVRRDGSLRVLEWTSTPVIEERVTYAVARDVTDRRQAEVELERLAEEQGALRRVATLVVQGVPAAEVLAAVAEELERLFDAQATTIGRLEADGALTIVASTGSRRASMPVVAVPIVVEGSLWGSMSAATVRQRFPADTEQRMANGAFQLEVSDDGIGGARPDGTGLVRLADRLAVLDGQLRVDRPAGGGTLVTAEIPLRG